MRFYLIPWEQSLWDFNDPTHRRLFNWIRSFYLKKLYPYLEITDPVEDTVTGSVNMSLPDLSPPGVIGSGLEDYFARAARVLLLLVTPVLERIHNRYERREISSMSLQEIKQEVIQDIANINTVYSAGLATLIAECFACDVTVLEGEEVLNTTNLSEIINYLDMMLMEGSPAIVRSSFGFFQVQDGDVYWAQNEEMAKRFERVQITAHVKRHTIAPAVYHNEMIYYHCADGMPLEISVKSTDHTARQLADAARSADRKYPYVFIHPALGVVTEFDGRVSYDRGEILEDLVSVVVEEPEVVTPMPQFPMESQFLDAMERVIRQAGETGIIPEQKADAIINTMKA